MTHLIPPERLDAVEAALFLAFQTTAPDTIELLSGGLSGSGVYRIAIQEQDCLLKLDPPGPGSDNGRATVLRRVSGAGIAPQLFYRNDETGISLSRFIAGQPLRASLTPEEIARALGERIRLWHSLPCDVPGEDLSVTVDLLISGFRANRLLMGGAIDEGLARYDRIRQAAPWRDADLVLSHNDLNPANILCEGKKLWVIDWDGAGRNNRYLDLAATANFFTQSAEEEQLLLRVYFGREPSEEEQARLFLMRQVSRLIYGLLLTDVAARTCLPGQILNQEMDGFSLGRFGELAQAGKLSLRTSEGQLFYAKANLNEAFRQMASGRLEDALHILRHVQ